MERSGGRIKGKSGTRRRMRRGYSTYSQILGTKLIISFTCTGMRHITTFRSTIDYEGHLESKERFAIKNIY